MTGTTFIGGRPMWPRLLDIGMSVKPFPHRALIASLIDTLSDAMYPVKQLSACEGGTLRRGMKRSVLLHGRETSITLEPEFWQAFREIAAGRRMTIQALTEEVACTKTDYNLSSHIRVFVLQHTQSMLGRKIRKRLDNDGV